MIEIQEKLIPKGSKRRAGKPMTNCVGVTIHNTGNTDIGATAKANAAYYNNSANDAVAGTHYFIDDKECYCVAPDTEIVEHSGKRQGNDTTVAIEICDNSDGDLRKATDRGAELAASILKKKGFSKAVWKQNIFQHNDWSGKDCPQDIRAGKPYDWTTFVNQVNKYMGNSETTVTPSIPKLTRNLKLTSPMMRGEDVRQAQERLQIHHANPGKIDGIFGQNTKAATIRFQEARIREKRDLGSTGADGVIGQKTWAILWE